MLPKKYNYYKRDYRNPFFKERNFGRLRKTAGFAWTKRKAIIIIIAVLFLILAWFIFFSYFFKIKQIEASGSGKISSEEISSIAWEQTKKSRFLMGGQDNFFLFKKSELAATLKQKYNFKDIKITKSLFNKIKINLEEKNYNLIWKEGDSYFFINEDGDVVYNASFNEVSNINLPIIENLSQNFINGNKTAFAPKYLSYVLKLNGKMAENNFEVEKFVLDSNANTVKVKFKPSQVLIYFNIDEDLDSQIKKLTVLINESLKDSYKNKNYIDLRYGDKVYYK